jgi:two-component sensor histidine kinase
MEAAFGDGHPVKPKPELGGKAACEGLGMTLVSSLVAQIGGELRIDRGEANDCTRFTVLFG